MAGLANFGAALFRHLLDDSHSSRSRCAVVDMTLFDPVSIVHDLLWLSAESQARCLVDTRKWYRQIFTRIPLRHRHCQMHSLFAGSRVWEEDDMGSFIKFEYSHILQLCHFSRLVLESS
jgi:hypothetical protein